MKATGHDGSPATIVRDARPAPQQAALGLTSAEVYAARHGRVDQNVFTYAVAGALFERLGITLHSGTGYAGLSRPRSGVSWSRSRHA